MSAEGTDRSLVETPNESEERFQTIFAKAAVGIAQIGLDGEWLVVNNRFCQMLGYSETELRTKTLQDISQPDDFVQALAGRHQLLAGEISSHTMEKRYIRKDGTVFWGRLNRSLVRDHDNLPKYFISVVEDITDRILAESALRYSEQRLTLAQSAAHVGVWDCDLHTNVTLISGEYARIHGLAPDHPPLTHEEWLRLVHSDDRGRVRALLEESIEKRHVWDHEFRVVWPDGSVHWLLGKGEVQLDESGRPIRMAGISLDITERKQSEEVRSHLAAIVESSDDAIVGETIHGEVVSWNPGAERIYGYKAEEMLGRPISLLSPPECPDEVPQILERLRHGERLEHFETTRVRKDGCRIEVSVTISPINDSTGAVVGASVITREITGQKRAEAALRESEERFRGVFEEGPLGLALVGMDFHFLKVNRALCEMVGYTEEELLQMSFADITHPDDLRADVELAERLFRGEIPFYKLQKRYLKKSGEIIWINLTASVIRDRQGQPTQGLAMIEDITEVMRAQEQALARQKLESLGILAGGIAHDFNNLLGGILAEAELIEADLSADPSSYDEIQRIKANAIRGAEIVRELMIYAGQDQASLIEPVDLSRLVQEILELLKVSISKHAVLTTDLQKNLPAVWGRAPQFRQVVMNLVINASEAIGEKEGVINVTTEYVSGEENLARYCTTDLPAGDYVRLEVSDTGCGVPEEAKTKIFDPFFTTKFAGRGLGLAVVQGIVRAQGGSINLESAPGQGTRVQVMLPCTSMRALEAQNIIAAAGNEQFDLQAGTILMVEDEEALRLAVSKALTRRGFSVVEACDGSAAMELIRTRADDIDVVLLDATLPGMSSREVFQEVQRIRPSVKMILTSAYSKETVEAAFPGLRIDHFIRKPFQLVHLLKLLQGADPREREPIDPPRSKS